MFGKKKSKTKETTSTALVRQDPRTTVRTTTAQSETTNTTVQSSTIVNSNTNRVEWRTTQRRVTHQQQAGIAEILIRRTPTVAELEEMLDLVNMNGGNSPRRESPRAFSAKSRPSDLSGMRRNFPPTTPTTPTVSKYHNTTVTQKQGRTVTSHVEQNIFKFSDFTKSAAGGVSTDRTYGNFDASPFPRKETTTLAAITYPKTPSTFKTTTITTTKTIPAPTYVSPYRSTTTSSFPSISSINYPSVYSKSATASSTARDAKPLGVPASPVRKPIYSANYPNLRSSVRPTPAPPTNPVVTTGNSSGKTVRNSANKSKLKPGYVYILNNESFDDKNNDERIGSKHDVKIMRKTLEAFKLKVEVVENPTVRQISDLVAKIERKDYSNNACIVIAILTHGSRREEVAAKDGNYSIDDHIVFPILRNRTLEDKPKIFFIQACKGAIVKGGFHTDSSKPFGSPNEILKCYSTFEGYVAYRTETGSPFIQALCETLQRDGHEKSITEILDNVREVVKALTGGKQIPSVTTTLTKPFSFGDYL